MNASHLKIITALRRQLHACPELSGHETVSFNTLYDFLKAHTALKLEKHEGWLLAIHHEGDDLPNIGFRADVDAIPSESEIARHGCGHDGHSAILCGLALALEGQSVGKNVYLIFQSAEETGQGAQLICNHWPGLTALSRIYGLHNIPGYPTGTLLMRDGCFACASCGLIIRIQGRPAHAAYPGDGANPSELLSRLVLETSRMIEDILAGDGRLLMRTVVGLRAGGENFGLSASEGQLCLTLRGHRQSDIDALVQRIEAYARDGCASTGMTCDFELRDVFPDTTNDSRATAEARRLWERANLRLHDLAEPMRWSEDFGWYLKQAPGMFFGIGAGETWPGLHTRAYEFNDELIAPAVDAFTLLARG